MKVWISGATGFIGSNLVKSFLRENHIVIAFVTNSIKAHLIFSEVDTSKIKIAVGDALDYGSIIASMEDDTDVVINTIGIIMETKERSFKNIHVNVVKNIVSAAKQKGIKRFIHISALGTRENAMSLYHQTKWEGEKHIVESGLSYTIFRPSVVYGIGDGFTKKIIEILSIPFILPLPAGGNNLLQPIYVLDLVKFVIDSINKVTTYNKIIELVGPDILRFKEILLKVKQIKKYRYKIPVYIPHFVLKIMAFFAERFQKTPFITKDQIIMLKEDNIAPQSDMKLLFPDITATHFDEGIKEVLSSWYTI